MSDYHPDLNPCGLLPGELPPGVTRRDYRDSAGRLYVRIADAWGEKWYADNVAFGWPIWMLAEAQVVPDDLTEID